MWSAPCAPARRSRGTQKPCCAPIGHPAGPSGAAGARTFTAADGLLGGRHVLGGAAGERRHDAMYQVTNGAPLRWPCVRASLAPGLPRVTGRVVSSVECAGTLTQCSTRCACLTLVVVRPALAPGCRRSRRVTCARPWASAELPLAAAPVAHRRLLGRCRPVLRLPQGLQSPIHGPDGANASPGDESTPGRWGGAGVEFRWNVGLRKGRPALRAGRGALLHDQAQTGALQLSECTWYRERS